MKNTKGILFISLVIFLLALNIGLNIHHVNKKTQNHLSSVHSANTDLKIVATITIIGNIVQNVVGHNIPVIVPGSADPHSYEPTSGEISALENADIIFRMGVEDLEPWWRSEWNDALVVNLVNPKMLEIDPLLGFDNPHVWMDPNNMINFTKEVNNTLWKEDPSLSNKWIYSNNTSNYLADLENLLVKIQSNKPAFNGMKVVVNHPAYFYLFRKNLLNLTRLATIGKGEDQEPSAKEIADVIKIMREEGCHLVVTDPQHRTANVYEIARNTHSKIAMLTPLLNVEVYWNGKHVFISNYTQMIEYDIWALKNPSEPPSLTDLWYIIGIFGGIIITLLILFLYIRRKK
ncbi:MAG: metal ABC transporter substrate-binding protein [Candidatus Lokiarchaeota archaeon]